jgi:hypothetical protein
MSLIVSNSGTIMHMESISLVGALSFTTVLDLLH